MTSDYWLAVKSPKSKGNQMKLNLAIGGITLIKNYFYSISDLDLEL